MLGRELIISSPVGKLYTPASYQYRHSIHAGKLSIQQRDSTTSPAECPSILMNDAKKKKKNKIPLMTLLDRKV
jgi:hypothetical protein